jgi:hypothetical protein
MMSQLAKSLRQTVFYPAVWGVWGYLIALQFQSSSAHAAPVTFTIDPAQSSISLSGTVVGTTVKEQAPGSLTTSFSGSVTAELTDSTITFTTAGLVIANNNGEWEPKANGAVGKEPANYGAAAQIAGAAGTAAARNIQFQLSSASLALADGSFDASAIVFQFPTNSPATLAYRTAGFLSLSGSESLSGVGTNRNTTKATLATNGDIQTLTIPIEADFYFKLIVPNDTKLTISKQLVATRRLGGASTTFESWVSGKFAGQSDPNVTGANADPDGDGLPNFVEYAFGLGPTKPDSSFAPLIARIDPAAATVLSLEYTRPSGLGGINYSIEVSADLVNWTPLSVLPEITDQGGGQEKVVIRDNQPISSLNQLRRFMRLSVAKI